MAVYNGEAFVAEGIASLLAQTFTDFELIIIDDGSTDRTAEIVRSFADGRLRFFQNGQNCGLAATLNRGLSLASGEFIARQDADDRSMPTRFEHQVAFMDAHPDVALVGSWYVDVDAIGAPRGRGRRTPPTRNADLLWHLQLYCPFVHSSVMWRRQVVADVVGSYDERYRYSMDYDFWRRIADRCRVANVDRFLVEVRVHTSSMTATYGDDSREGLRMAAGEAARLLNWPADQALRESRFQAIFDVVFGQSPSRTVAEVQQAARDVMQLHAAFTAERSLEDEDSRRQRSDLRARVARQTWRSARLSAGAGHLGNGVALLTNAVRRDPRTVAAEAVTYTVGRIRSVLRR